MSLSGNAVTTTFGGHDRYVEVATRLQDSILELLPTRYKLDDIIHPDDKDKYGIQRERSWCNICSEILDIPVEARCGKGHIFCLACLDNEQCCPMCRHPFGGGPKGELLPAKNLVLWRLLLLLEVRVRSFSS